MMILGLRRGTCAAQPVLPRAQRGAEAARATAFDEQLVEDAKRDILSNYYSSCVGDLPPHVAEFIEAELITEKGFRDSYAREDAVPSHLTDDELAQLIGSRLLRLEDYHGAQRIELTHDVLTGVVREHRDRRLAEKRRQKRRRRRWRPAQRRNDKPSRKPPPSVRPRLRPRSNVVEANSTGPNCALLKTGSGPPANVRKPPRRTPPCYVNARESCVACWSRLWSSQWSPSSRLSAQ